MSFFKAAGELIKPLANAPIKSYETYQKLRDRITQTTFESIDREIGVFGDPDYCVERIQTLRQEFPMEEFICYFNRGGLIDHATDPALDGVVRRGSDPTLPVSEGRLEAMVRMWSADYPHQAATWPHSQR